MKPFAAVATAAVATAALTIGAFWLLDDDRASDLETSRSLEQPQRRKIDDREWRWESNRGIELQVPADWGYRVVGGDWCADGMTVDPAPGGVSRGREASLAIGCDPRHPPLDQRKAAVTLLGGDSASSWPTRVERLDGGWAEESRLIHGVLVTVFTDDNQVRAHIFDSARTIDGLDAYGCPVEHQATVGRGYRPDPGRGGLATVGEVEDISVCRYLRDDTKSTSKPLISSSHIAGAEARRIVAEMLAAPEGSGPNSPGNCVSDYDYGEEMLVLTVRGAKGQQEVVLRYHGCIGHGTDDGVTKRRLTKESARPLLDGPHRPSGVSGRWMAKIVGIVP